MGNLLNEKENPKPAAPAGPSDAERAAYAQGAASALAAENSRLNEQMRVRSTAPAAPVAQTPDPFLELGAEHLTAAPGEFAQKLDEGTRRRVNAAVGHAARTIEGRAEARLAEAEGRIALNTILGANPDLAADPEGFAAAIAKADFRAGQMGQTLDGPTKAQFALSIYRADHAAPTMAPTVEGASRPGAAGGPRAPERPRGKSYYEQFYGTAPGDVLHEEEINQEDMTKEYVDKRLEDLESHGAVIDESLLQSVLEGNQSRKARRAAAGGR
jgi:hypothetical protein